MRDFETGLRTELRDPEYSEGYAESYLNSYIATQIKVIREQRGMTQDELGDLIGTTQGGVSRYENVNYSSWNIKTLIKFARAFHVRLKVSFEPFGTLPEEVTRFTRDSLERVKRENDPGLQEPANKEAKASLEDLIGRYLSTLPVKKEVKREEVKKEPEKVVSIDTHGSFLRTSSTSESRTQSVLGGACAAGSGG
jgi:transcriptional regulator with XRE-family HTH domain